MSNYILEQNLSSNDYTDYHASLALEVEQSSFANDERIHWWIRELAREFYFASWEIAIALEDWYESRQGPLTLKGLPGTGKTVLAIKAAKVKGASFYRLPCMADVGRREALYNWDQTMQAHLMKLAIESGTNPDPKKTLYNELTMVPGILVQALKDPSENVVILIDELDKAPKNQAFEGMLLEFLEENAITIPETGERITPVSGVPPRTFITANEDPNAMEDSLSLPVLRRTRFLWLDEPSLPGQYAILNQNAPRLSYRVLCEAVLFTKYAREKLCLEKFISISEVIMWVRALERRNIKTLTEAIITETLFALAKNKIDRRLLMENSAYLLSEINKSLPAFIATLAESGINVAV